MIKASVSQKEVNIAEVKLRIILTGGGSGGHIYPLISVFRSIKKMAGSRLMSVDAAYFGPDGFGEDTFKEEGIKMVKIQSGKLRRYFSILNFFDVFKLIFGFFQSLYQIWKFMPDLIFSKGGFGSIPVVVVGRLYRIPIFIHESDTVPGLSNRFAAKFAKRIAVSFDKAFDYFPKDKTALTGNPIRTELIFNQNKELARKNLGFNQERPLLLVLGGSQGAQSINELILESLEGLMANGVQILHQTGKANFRQVAAEAKIILESIPGADLKFYQAKDFLNEKEYAQALAACDLVVARAGSGTIFEISAAKKPSILIPLPESAGDHQKVNAYEYAKVGAAQVLEEANILPNLFVEQVANLLSQPEKLNDLGNRANLFFQQDAPDKIAKEIFDYLKIPV